MDRLPDELVDEILSFLTPIEIVTLQCVARRYLRLGRDRRLWRSKCYHHSPQTTTKRAVHKSWSQALTQALVSDQESSGARSGKIPRVTDEWDLSDPSERIDWYSEYIARHARVSASWLGAEDAGGADHKDVRGVALYQDRDGKKVVGPIGDGSLMVWDLEQGDHEPSRHSRFGRACGRSGQGMLLKQLSSRQNTSRPDASRSLALTGITDGVSIDVARHRAYVAVGDVLSEVDLNRLEVVSQTSYAWTIMAISDIQNPCQPLTVGTTLSLHILDPRTPSRDGSSSSSSSSAVTADLDHLVAFFQPKTQYDLTAPRGAAALSGFERRSPDHTPHQWNLSDPSHLLGGSIRSNIRPAFAELEPAPVSILHQAEHSILAAGRFPSILNYDRRYFPRLEYVLHSGARLSALAYLPFPIRGVTPPSSSSSAHTNGTIISCGEYNGRGSLEFYSIPHNTPTEPRTSSSSSNYNIPLDSDDDMPWHSSSRPEPQIIPGGTPGYRNRQSASSSKLLSLTTQGTRIVVSDADGNLNWMERDGRNVVRKWNVNGSPPSSCNRYRHNKQVRLPTPPSSAHGELSYGYSHDDDDDQVIRKIVPTTTTTTTTPAPASGVADDLLIWTGERIGLVTFGSRRSSSSSSSRLETSLSQSQPQSRQHERNGIESTRSNDRHDYIHTTTRLGSDAEADRTEMEMEMEMEVEALREREREREREYRYEQLMRRALERQSYEMNWMRDFGVGSGGGGGGGLGI